MIDPFRLIYPREKLSEEFLTLYESKVYDPAKKLIEKISIEFDDKDGNFIEQFQTDGFKARLWELFLFEFFKENNFKIINDINRPDFHLEKENIDIFVEASTSDKKAGDVYTKEFIEESIKRKDIGIQNELIDYFVIRMGSVLFSKLDKKYWELNWVKSKPLILAITPNHNHIANFLPDSKIIEYLYGLRYNTDLIGEELVLTDIENVEIHKHKKKEIPSNFFSQENVENISAVIFTNNCDLHKFNRIGFQMALSVEKIVMVRAGIAYNPNPISTGNRFSYNLTPGDMKEDWSESVTIFHNPNAINKLDLELFKGVRQVIMDVEGKLDGFMPNSFIYNSMTMAMIIE